MRIVHSSRAKATGVDDRVKRALESVSESYLRVRVEALSIPRHFFSQPRNNKLVAESIASELESLGYEVEFQGAYANVVARAPRLEDEEMLLVGAHYDSVPSTPGADDNASGVAALLACAKALSELGHPSSVCFVAFNREEDGLAGSTDFVDKFADSRRLKVREAIILEMVGYSRREPGSQLLPPRLPITVPDTGDFLGVVANAKSSSMLDVTMRLAKTYVGDMPVLGLKIFLGIEKKIPVLRRSDHDPFWQAGIPAVMWTDTAEFRNPNYHQPTDTPDTLDYGFLRRVTQLLVAFALCRRT